MKEKYIIKILKLLICFSFITLIFFNNESKSLLAQNLRGVELPNLQMNQQESLYARSLDQFKVVLKSPSIVSVSQHTQVDIQLGIQGNPIPINEQTYEEGMEILILLDISKDLTENESRVDEAIKWALLKFSSNFRNQDYVKIGLITYNNEPTLSIGLNTVNDTNFESEVQNVIDSYEYSDTTSNLSKAISLANNTFTMNNSKIGKKIILFSNEIEENEAQKSASLLENKDIELNTFGISTTSTSDYTNLISFYNQVNSSNDENFHEVPGGAIWNLEKIYLPNIVDRIKYSYEYGNTMNGLEIIFMLDVSGNILNEDYKNALKWALVSLAKIYYDNPNVKVGFISYAEKAEEVIQLTTPNYSNVEEKLLNYIKEQYWHDTKTNIREALELANNLFTNDAKVAKQIILVGQDNNLIFDNQNDAWITNELQKKQVDIFTYTKSSNPNSKLLEIHQQISNSSTHHYYQISDFYNLEKDEFIKQGDLTLNSLGQIVYRNVELVLNTNGNFWVQDYNDKMYLNNIIYNRTTSNQYETDEINVYLKVTPWGYGKLEFGNSYLNINGQSYLLPLPIIYTDGTKPPTPEIDQGSVDIRILEIQPGDDFQLMGDNVLSTTGRDYYTFDDNIILIDHVSMPEFIGKITELNGYYDIIVIGNKTSGNKTYSQINIGGSSESDYNENDITERKADEIIKFIESGKLVYMDESILTDSNLKESNLYKKFNSIVADNFKKFKNWELGNQSALSIDKIITHYMDEAINKSPKFSITKLPNSDSQESNSGQIANRHMEFELDIPEEAEGYQLTLFLDINGDGLYREDEIVKVIEQVTASSTYQFSYEMDPYFVGKIDWKIELTSRLNNKGEAIKSYSLGSTYFKNTSQTKLPIKVLQVYSYRRYEDAQNDQQHRNNEASNLLLSSEKFQNIVNEQSDYEINVTEVPASFFNECAGKEVCIYKGQSYDGIHLNGNYDMIIFGFGDYPADISSETAINEIKSFIQSGQSVMFTHDNFGDKELLDWLKNTTGFSSHIFSDSLRTFIGQARFKGNDNIIKNLYQSYDTVQKRYDYLEIPLLNIGEKINSIDGLSTARPSLGHNNQVYKTNEALITTYPFNIDNIQVAQTHRQYFQLNLEDPDVVPWLNLANNGGYDSKNEYYTYSKGNITFSGTGHSDAYTDDELRLFVNTIVKAGRGANHAPTIESSLDDLPGTGDASTSIKCIDITPNEDFPFNMIVRDIDGDDVTVTITIDNEIYSETVAQGTKIDKIIPASSVVVNQPIIIKLEAKDKSQAQATPKVYQLNPIEFQQPTIKFISQNLEYRALAGDIINIQLEFEKIFDDHNQIEIQDVELVTFNEGILQVIGGGQSIQFNSNKVFLSYRLMPLGTMQNEKVLGKLRYKIKGSDTFDETIFSFTISALSGSATIKLIDENGNPYKYQATAKLSNEKTEWDPVVLDALGMSEYAWNNKEDKYLNSSNYQMKLELPNGYEVKSITQDNQIVSESFSLSYDNPTVNRIYTIGLASNVDTTNNLIHGLDEGVRNGQLQVTEGMVQLIPDSHANILARVCILHKQEPIYLNIDKKFIDSDALSEKIKVYKWENNSLVELIDVSVNYIESNSNQEIYVINFRNTAITDETDIVIKYPVQLNSDENTYINNVLYTIDGNVLQKEFKIETAELPDLF